MEILRISLDGLRVYCDSLGFSDTLFYNICHHATGNGNYRHFITLKSIVIQKYLKFQIETYFLTSLLYEQVYLTYVSKAKRTNLQTINT